ATVLDLADKQLLLEAPDAARRLRLEAGFLRREVAVVRLLPSLPAVELTRAGVSPN
ncbi:MAG TPA: ATP-dependent protease, partial [Candidatus Eisenbacteria bacterium]|nr:ATP-dependent protease [Candidatus Eisenbacteria bacterium]